MADVILVLNAGSSSLKFSVFDVESDQRPLLKGADRGSRHGAAIRRQDAQEPKSAPKPGATAAH
jgi:acetate kinase